MTKRCLRRRLWRAVSCLGLLLFCMAPTPGDVGGCGQKRQELDEELFFDLKNSVDCERCNECGLRTLRCDEACADDHGGRSFPEGCLPLVHDGEVCLRRLLDVDCDTFAGYVDDRSPGVPTECNFCPEEGER